MGKKQEALALHQMKRCKIRKMKSEVAVVYACFKSTQEHKGVTFELMSQFLYAYAFYKVCVSKYDIIFPYLPATH